MTTESPSVHKACTRLLRSVRLPLHRAPELARFWAPAEDTALDAGDVLLREGDRGDSLLFLVEGTIAVSILDDRGEPMDVARLAAPLLLGTTGAVDGAARMATCTLTTPGRVLRMRRGIFVDAARRATPEAEVVRELMLLTMHRQLVGANARLRETLKTQPGFMR